MKTFEAVPLHNVGPIAFGMPRSEVRALLGAHTGNFLKEPASMQPVDAWHNNAFQVFYDSKEAVEYIELSRTKDFSVACLGMPVFNTSAALLIEHIMQRAAVDTTDPEHGYSYIFPSLELSLWRPATEGAEASHFSTIGFGRRGYYSNAA
jgi:hypothetical protein